MNDWPVRIPSRLRPAIEEIGREEYRKPQDVVRFFVERALAERAIKSGRAPNDGAGGKLLR
jgi:hypothetical protein